MTSFPEWHRNERKVRKADGEDALRHEKFYKRESEQIVYAYSWQALILWHCINKQEHLEISYPDCVPC